MDIRQDKTIGKLSNLQGTKIDATNIVEFYHNHIGINGQGFLKSNLNRIANGSGSPFESGFLQVGGYLALKFCDAIDENGQLRRENEALTNDNARLTYELREEKREKEKWQGKSARRDERLDRRGREFDELNDENGELKREIAQLKREKVELRHKMDGKVERRNNRIDRLEEKNEQLSNELRELKHEKRTLSRSITRKDEEMVQLQQQLEQMTKERDDYKTECDIAHNYDSGGDGWFELLEQTKEDHRRALERHKYFEKSLLNQIRKTHPNYVGLSSRDCDKSTDESPPYMDSEDSAYAHVFGKAPYGPPKETLVELNELNKENDKIIDAPIGNLTNESNKENVASNNH